MDLKDIQKLVAEEYRENGYEQMWSTIGVQTKPEIAKLLRKKSDLAELGLIDTETAEAKEEVRNENTDDAKLGKECADIIIRTLNFMTRKGLDAESFIVNKHNVNKARGHLHGRNV